MCSIVLLIFVGPSATKRRVFLIDNEIDFDSISGRSTSTFHIFFIVDDVSRVTSRGYRDIYGKKLRIVSPRLFFSLSLSLVGRFIVSKEETWTETTISFLRSLIVSPFRFWLAIRYKFNLIEKSWYVDYDCNIVVTSDHRRSKLSLWKNRS